ncbi:MAG: hypothetical protein AzoDbin1_04864 [Azoarcus sp.]|nr:hypothetical protein [Azoarcus sp.]
MAGRMAGLGEPARALGQGRAAVFLRGAALLGIGGEQLRGLAGQVPGEGGQHRVDLPQRGEAVGILAPQGQAGEPPFLHVARRRNRDPQHGRAEMADAQPALAGFGGHFGRQGSAAEQFAAADALAHVFAQQGVDDADADVVGIRAGNGGSGRTEGGRTGGHCAISHASLPLNWSTAAARPAVSGPLPCNTPT